MPKARYIYLFSFLVCVVYALAYAAYGFSDTDHGFVQALSWRILEGQVPYLDFLYVRPPGSPYFHAAWLALLPDSWESIGERVLFYVLMTLSTCWSVISLRRVFSFRKLGIAPAGLGVLALILSLHNFPPMAWHTVDGLFWGALGFLGITHPKIGYRTYLGLLAFVMAALMKQAFYPLPLIGGALVILLHERTTIWKSIGMTAGTVLLGTLFVYFWEPNFLPTMLQQITGATSLQDLYAAGIEPYLKPLVFVVLPLLVAWQAMSLYKWRLLPAGLFWVVLIGYIAYYVWKAWHTQTSIGPEKGFAQVFWLLGVGLCLKNIWVNKKAYGLLLGMLLMAWCGGISWGYATPMLYFTPILFAFLLGLREEIDFRVPRYFYALLGAFLVWAYAMLAQFPYRDAPRAALIYPMAQVFPQMQGIYTGETMFRKSQELQRLQRQYGDKFTVLPAYPLAHYLTDSPPILGVDWAHNAECQYSVQTERLQQALAQLEYVLLQTDEDKKKEWEEAGKYGCLLAGYVATHWKPETVGDFFTVYRPPFESSD